MISFYLLALVCWWQSKVEIPSYFVSPPKKWFTEKAEFVPLGFLEVLWKSFFLYWSGILNGPKSKIFCYCKYIPVLFPTFHRLSCTKRAEKGLFSFPFISTSCILLFVSLSLFKSETYKFPSKKIFRVDGPIIPKPQLISLESYQPPIWKLSSKINYWSVDFSWTRLIWTD